MTDQCKQLEDMIEYMAERNEHCIVHGLLKVYYQRYILPDQEETMRKLYEERQNLLSGKF